MLSIKNINQVGIDVISKIDMVGLAPEKIEPKLFLCGNGTSASSPFNIKAQVPCFHDKVLRALKTRNKGNL